MAPPEIVGGRYRLHRPIGKGALGEVFSGVDLSRGVPVAVKLLRSELAFDEGLAGRLAEEARSASRVHHANVVEVLDAGEDQGRPWLVMELLPGWTLADELRRGPLDPTSALVLASAVLSGLAAIHAAGIVHRDIKPHNILGDPGGTWKVGDFGIAKGAWSAGELTSHGIVLGTLAYLAPERLEGLAATEASDLWSFGVVLWEALAGQRPFPSDSLGALARAIHGAGPLDLEVVAPATPPELAEVVRRCLEPDPASRPLNAREALDLLEPAYRAVLPGSTSTPTTRTSALDAPPLATARQTAVEGTVRLATSEPATAHPSGFPAGSEERPLALPGPDGINWLVAALVVAGLVLATLLALAAAAAGRSQPAALPQPPVRSASFHEATTARAWASELSSSTGTEPKSNGFWPSATGGSGMTRVSTRASSTRAS